MSKKTLDLPLETLEAAELEVQRRWQAVYEGIDVDIVDRIREAVKAEIAYTMLDFVNRLSQEVDIRP